MRQVVFVFLVSSLLVTLAFVQRGNIPVVKASSILSSSIYQGDLILNGNNVTVIEDRRFDINGSIIVEENATLILRNAIVNFTQMEDRQFNMTFRHPAHGNPRLLVENATINSNHYLEVEYYGNSSASISMLTTLGSIRLRGRDSSVVNLSDSFLFGAMTFDDSILNLFNCTVLHLWATGNSSVGVSDSIIDSYVNLIAYTVNCSITGVERGIVSYWNFKQNCSVTAAPSGSAPNLTLMDTRVDGWSFDFYEFSNVTIVNSNLMQIRVTTSVVSVYYSSFDILIGQGGSAMYIFDSTTNQVMARDSCRFWLVNSTSNYYSIKHESGVYVCWYLDVHVVDSIGQNVPSANVTATYPNATMAESKLTDTDGWTELILMEKMMNATGDYPVRNYTVEAIYLSYSDDTTVNMTENKQITLTLEDFIIPEFPSLIILPLFMMTTLLAVILYRRKHPI